MFQHKPKPIVTVLSERPAAINVNKEEKIDASRLDQLAIWMAGGVGSMKAFLLIVAWCAVWLLWNIAAPRTWQFDPAPGFVMWLFLSNLFQICLMPLLLVSANLQAKHAQRQSENDYAVDQQTEREMKSLLENIDYQNKMLEEIHRQLMPKSDGP